MQPKSTLYFVHLQFNILEHRSCRRSLGYHAVSRTWVSLFNNYYAFFGKSTWHESLWWGPTLQMLHVRNNWMHFDGIWHWSLQGKESTPSKLYI